MMNKGFTLIEIILVMAITLIIASIAVGTFSKLNENIAIQKDAEKIVSLLRKAQANTLSSRSGSQYGVHFENKKVVIFAGDTYVASVSSEFVALGSHVAITTISLAGGGSDLVFKKLTGQTDKPGYIILSLVNSPAISKRVNTSFNGIANIQ